MKLRPLENTVVHCKTKEEYDRLMQIYEDAGWLWNGDDRQKPTQYDGWKSDYECFHCYQIRDEFCRQSSAHTGEKEISLAEFLREQGIDQPTIKIGKKYRPKAKRVHVCPVLDDKDDIAYVVFNRIAERCEDGEILTAFRKDGSTICSCGCWDHEDLEPYENETKPEEFKVGDWVEVIEWFSDQDYRGDLAAQRKYDFAVGEKFRVGEWPYHTNMFVLALPDGPMRVDQKYFRRCSPPEEKVCSDHYEIPADTAKAGDRYEVTMNGTYFGKATNVTIKCPESNSGAAVPFWKQPRPISFPHSFMSTCTEAVKNGVQFLRDGLLTDGEVALRKVGFKDHNGQWTGIDSSESSAVATLIQLLLDSHEEELTDLATKMIAADEKKKKK